MVKRHAPSPFIFSIYPSLLSPFPGLLSCIPLPRLHPHTFFKEMRYNLQDRSCLAFSDKALIAAQGELRGYTSPRWTGPVNTSSPNFTWTESGVVWAVSSQGTREICKWGIWLRIQARHTVLTPLFPELLHNRDKSVPLQTGRQEAGIASLHLFKLPCDRGMSPVSLNLVFMEKWQWWSQIWILDPPSLFKQQRVSNFISE